MVEVHD